MLLKSTYHWFKMLHLIAMVAWFAGLFYIFRLFVYHVKHREEPSVVAALTVMEHKLLKIIMMPAMVTTWVFGVTMLVLQPGWFKQGWLVLKLVALVVLTGYHLYSIAIHKTMKQGTYPLSERACRMINEVPTLLLLLIVFLAVLKPF